jgi:hypothetical protein
MGFFKSSFPKPLNFCHFANVNFVFLFVKKARLWVGMAVALRLLPPLEGAATPAASFSLAAASQTFGKPVPW